MLRGGFLEEADPQIIEVSSDIVKRYSGQQAKE